MPGPASPRPFRPGQVLSAEKLNDVAENAWRAVNVMGQGDAGIIRPAGNAPIVVNQGPRPTFARITGRASGCANSGESGGSGTPGSWDVSGVAANCYCGIEQISRRDGTVEDLETGMHWDAFSYPLVEMSENPDVPLDAIVEAYISADRTHWEFLFTEQAVGESGSGCGSGCTVGVDLSCLIRCVGGVLTVTSGCLYVMINGEKFYLQIE